MAVASTIANEFMLRQQAERRLAAQYFITHALSESATLVEACPKIIRALCECMGWDHGTVWIVDSAQGVLRCVDFWCSRPETTTEIEAVTRWRTFAPGDGLPGQVWESGQPVWGVGAGRVAGGGDGRRAVIEAGVGLLAGFAFPITRGAARHPSH